MDIIKSGGQPLFDFHSHILPGMDDGSGNPELSVEMLMELKKQNVEGVIFTPHYYLKENTVEAFLEKRKAAVKSLKHAMEQRGYKQFPYYALGAEVHFCNKLYQISEIEKLKLGASNYFLLELPYEKKIDLEIIEEVDTFTEVTGFTVVLAHYERYADRITWRAERRLKNMEVIFQINADSLFKEKTISLVRRLIKRGETLVLGSDCHNMKERSPKCMRDANEKLEQLMSDKFLCDYYEKINSMFAEVKGNEKLLYDWQASI